MTCVMSMKELGKAIETKFAHDQELEFRIDAHAQILVAEWAAERIGLDPDSSQKFVIEWSEWSLKPGNRNMKQRLLRDFAANGVEISEGALDRLFALKRDQARKKIVTA